METGQQLTFESLLGTFRSGGAAPRAGLLVELARQEPEDDMYVLGHKTTERSVRGQAGSKQQPAMARPEAAVHLLAKSTRNPFAGMVTIGRAENNDVILRDSSVSKFHAYFRLGAELRLHDASSSNGTSVDGRSFAVDGVVPSTLARIAFGPTCEFFFVAPSDVASWLQTLAPATEPGSGTWALSPRGA